LDVANSIISYHTLYHLKSRKLIPDDELYPAGLVHKALRDAAYRDPELIQYKSEVILKYFEEKVKNMLNGTAKAMVIASSRPAELLYYQTLKEKIEKKGLSYKILFAFSDFTDENNNMIREDDLNQLTKLFGGQAIEDVFDENDEYRIIVVANKFQAGFNQPKLVAMFLDKVVRDNNAVQTVSRLNRNYYEKDVTTVVDFTNSSQNIFNAFRRYRKGSRYNPQEPNPDVLQKQYDAFLAKGIFNEIEITFFTEKIKIAAVNVDEDAVLMALSNEYSIKFKKVIMKKEDQREVVNFLHRFVDEFYFIGQYFELPVHLIRFGLFAEVIADKLLKPGSESSLKKYLKELVIEKSAVRYKGIITKPKEIKDSPPPPRPRDRHPEPPKASIPEVMDDLRRIFQISDEEALLINQVIEELMKDRQIVDIIVEHQRDSLFLDSYKNVLKQRVINYYIANDWDDRLEKGPYISPGGIIDYMVQTIIRLCSVKAA
jgi:type I restriction enzyme R subunit